jgi:uncharacterized protein (UPF0548 family)
MRAVRCAATYSVAGDLLSYHKITALWLGFVGAADGATRREHTISYARPN